MPSQDDVLVSADVDVLLPVVAVVADVQDVVVDEVADGALGIVPVRDADPQRGAARTGIAEVQLDGRRVVGDGADDPR